MAYRTHGWRPPTSAYLRGSIERQAAAVARLEAEGRDVSYQLRVLDSLRTALALTEAQERRVAA